MDYDIDEIFGSFKDRQGEVHHYVDNETALAHLLLNDVLFSNGRDYVSSFAGEPQEISKETVVLFVNCNDLFVWACADAEELPHDEIGPLFKMWHADKRWGADKWCCLRRNMQPQGPIVRDMKLSGSWDDVMEALPKNPDSQR